ncbi:MAG: LLM class F420-dependent oxidoreductase [Actinomycetes bacterium]
MQNEHVNLGTYGIWTGALDAVSSARAGEFAGEVEELGFGALWIPETVAREVFVSSSLLLSATNSLVVATGIANRYGRDALTCAAAQQTLAEAFPGRFLLGLGVSHEHLVSKIRHHDYSKPYSAMVEYLDAMDSALYFSPKSDVPAQTVLAALGPKMLELAATRTAGAHPYFVPPEHTAYAREIMGAAPLLAVEQMVVLETDPSTARDVARSNMAIYMRLPNYTNNLRRLGWSEEDLADGGSDTLVDAIVAWGTVDQVLERVRAHLDAGADHVCIQALRADPTEVPVEEWRELAGTLGLPRR